MLLILPGSIGFFSEFRETRDARNAADTAVLGRQSQRMETGMNGRPKREGNGKTLPAEARCHGLQPRGRKCRTRANNRLLPRDIGASPVVAVAVPFSSTVQSPFPKKSASITGMSSPTLDRRVTTSRAKARESCVAMFRARGMRS